MLQATAAPSPLTNPAFSQTYFAAYRWMLQTLHPTPRPVQPHDPAPKDFSHNRLLRSSRRSGNQLANMKRHLGAKLDAGFTNTYPPSFRGYLDLAVAGVGPLQPRPAAGGVQIAGSTVEALPAKAPKAKGWKPILSVLIFLCCSSSLRSAGPAPEGEKHPLNKKIGFTTEKKAIAGVGKFVWEIQSFDDPSNPAKHVGISYEKKLHLPKLPHTDTAPGFVIDKVQLSLTITPPKGAKITSVSIKDAAQTKVTATTGYGIPFTTTRLSADATTLSKAGEIADAITVNIQQKQAGTEGTSTASFQIPLVRVDTLSETLILCTKKIKEEGQHENEYGSELKEPGAIERQLYFLPQKGEKVSISCIGHCLHALRHGYQKWDGTGAKVSIKPLTGMAKGSAIGFLQTLAGKGWTIYYISKDATLRAGRPGNTVLVQLTPCTDLLNCAVQGSPGQKQLTALCALPWALIVEASGLHVGMSLSGTLYEAHYLNTGDAIYDNRKSAKDFVLSENFGFIAVPP